MTSQATWKVIAADMPIGLIVVYDTDRKWGVEAIAPERRGRRAAASSRPASYEDVPSSVGLPGNP
jgi:phosphodiesterase/alkaline phosphatase D-like protein